LSGFEIPPFGVSENVDAIRAESLQDTDTTGLQKAGLYTGSKIYQIDAYGQDDTTGEMIKQGNDEINTIYLTLSYDPEIWNPTVNHVIYSEDDGETWITVPREDILAYDTERYTVTVQTSHLSLWSASLQENQSPTSEVVGLPSSDTSSSSGGGGGGGCLLR
jgi:hypothetical protein